jgi:hypothetical protein
MDTIETHIQELSQHVYIHNTEPTKGTIATWVSQMRTKVKNQKVPVVRLRTLLKKYNLRENLFEVDQNAMMSIRRAKLYLEWIKENGIPNYNKTKNPVEKKIARWVMNTRRAKNHAKDTRLIFRPEIQKMADKAGLSNLFDPVRKR